MSHYDYISFESWAKVKLSTNISFFITPLDNNIKDNKLVEQFLSLKTSQATRDSYTYIFYIIF